MKYRLKPDVQLVLVWDRDGKLNYHYQAAVHTDKGPLIPWLSDEQREQFLSEGLVEEIPDSEEPSVAGESEAASGAVDNCVAALDRLNVASDAGAPSCRDALREADFRFSNGTIAAAVKRRKQRPVAIPDSRDDPVLAAISGAGG